MNEDAAVRTLRTYDGGWFTNVTPYVSTMNSNLNVVRSTVWRTVNLFHRTGSVTPKKYDSVNLPQKLTDVVQFMLQQLILERPG